MNTEDAFWKQAEAGDTTALLILADLWEEEGRPESPGLRWLVERNVLPVRLADGSKWFWPDGRLPGRTSERLADEIGRQFWLHDSLREAMSAAAVTQSNLEVDTSREP